MNRLVLDTNIVSYVMKRRPEAELYRRHLDGQLLCISFITVGELFAGAEKAHWNDHQRRQLEENLKNYVVLGYDVEVAKAYGRAKAQTLHNPVADNDLWIAATALAFECALVTHNRRHFDRIRTLALITEQA